MHRGKRGSSRRRCMLMIETRITTMQKASLRKVKSSIGYTQENEDILHFTLNGLMPSGHTLALNTILGTLSQLFCDNTVPRLLGEQQFTTSEIYVLIPILEAHPYYYASKTSPPPYCHPTTTTQPLTRYR